MISYNLISFIYYGIFLTSISPEYLSESYTKSIIIFQRAHNSVEILIYFLPEIAQYDSEYVKKREISLIFLISNEKNSEALKKLYRLAKSDPQQHVINRTKCYNISSLHKCIREDDIDGFQSILSLNNFDDYLSPFAY